MKPFKPYAPNQTYLLPPSPKDWLPPDHLAHFIDEVVDQLDLSAIFRAYEGEDRGQPPYHPAMMVRVWLYAYTQGMRSSRRLERALYEDVAFRMLSGNHQPDHWTLSEFRRRHLQALGELFVQTVHLAQKAGLVKLGQVALDGTKIKAYASKRAAMSTSACKNRQFLPQGLERVRALWRLDCAVQNLLKLYRAGVRFKRASPEPAVAGKDRVKEREWAWVGAA